MTSAYLQFISAEALTSYHDMGRRAKYFTIADKAQAAKVYNTKYNQSSK